MLTEEQVQTIELPNENKLICALAGSGKTHTFISLAQSIVEMQSATSVLMLTFTNASAKEMEKRIKAQLTKKFAQRVKVATFASLMLQQFKPISVRRRSIIGPEQYTFVKRALAQEKQSYEDIDEWMSTIDELGRELVFEDNGSPSSRVFRAYCGILHNYNRYDLNMMARELIQGINNGSIAPYPHTHILCDEFQDTDPLQYQWLAAHEKKGAKLAVVGDDDQSIYSWRGSMGYRAFVCFQNDFDAAGYLLSLCFRCKGNILHAARGFIENNKDRIPKIMRSVEEGEGIVKVIAIPKAFVSDYTAKRLEAHMPQALTKAMTKKGGEKKSKGDGLENFRFVAQRISESESNGWAVLGRTNKHLDSVESAFSELGK